MACALINSIQAKAEKSGIKVFILDENQQIGDSFGERFAHAFQSIFDLGFENIISIGNDSPDLTLDHLNLAIQQMEKGFTVLGPTVNHGYYLIGLNKKQFHFKDFQELHWQTNLLQLSLSDYFVKSKTEITFLESLIDINSEENLLSFLEETTEKTSLFRVLFSIVFPTSLNHDALPIGAEKSLSVSIEGLRGPPTPYFNLN